MITSLEFGNFSQICSEVLIPVCNLWDPKLPLSCESSPVSIGGKSILGLGDLIVSGIGAILMLIIIIRTHNKFAAVGRKEMNIMFTFYFLICVFQIVTLSNIITSDNILQILSSIHIGLVLGFFWVLLMNGIVGYQLVEDGSTISFFGILTSGIVWIVVGTIFSLDASQNLLNAGTSSGPYSSVTLFGLYFIFPAIAVIGFTVLETILVAKNLGDQKPLINLYIGLVLFALSQVFLFVINKTICQGTNKSVSGSLFALLTNLAAIIFIYRFWDSITEDDWDNIDDIFV